MKHVDVDFHFIQDKVLQGLLYTSYISMLEKLASIFTKGLAHKSFDLLCGKLGMIDISVLA